jgi:hypothetical protein
MLPICAQCEQWVTEVSYAMRHHAAQMTAAISLARDYEAQAEEQRQELTAKLVASLNEAQSAWDAYCEHLIQHVLLPRRERS